MTENDKAVAYREAERPFITYNHPEVDTVVKKWADLDYVNSLVGAERKYEAETSPDNHFMYWKHRPGESRAKGTDGKPWSPPTGHSFSSCPPCTD